MNGVEKFWARLERRCKDARALGNNLIAAIGPATRDALAAKGLSADFVPESSVSENVAAGLLALGAARVLVVRALEGREALEKTLRADGCECVVAPAYRTVPNAANAGVVREKLARGEIHWITFTSSSTVTNFIAAVGKEVLASSRASFRVACIGPTTAQTATQNHLAPDVVAREASVESLIEAIVQVSAEAGAVR